MSTNPKDQTPKQLSEAIIAKSKRGVDRKVRNLMLEMEQENTLLQETPLGILQKVLKIFRATTPLFAVLVNLPFIPMGWRGAISMLVHALDALTEVGPDITASFKAGRDI